MKYIYIPNFIVYLGASASSTPIKGQTRTLTTAYATFEVATGYLDTQCCCMFTHTLPHSQLQLQSKSKSQTIVGIGCLASTRSLVHSTHALRTIQTERAMNYYAQFQLLKRAV